MSSTVVVFGSLHYDITVEARGWPQQGETAVGRAWAPKLGGKGRNQAVAAARTGASVAMIGAIGDDQFGSALRADLEGRRIDHSRLRVSHAAGTGMSVALFDETGDYRAVIVSGSNLTLGTADVPDGSFWSNTSVLVLQNEVPDPANALAASAAHAVGAMVILNAAPARPLSAELTAVVDLLIVNAVEAASLTGSPEPGSLEEAKSAALSLARSFPQVVVTAGSAGLAYAAGGEALLIAAEPVAVISTHGAGDALVGTLAAALAGGAPVRSALVTANHAAALHVSGKVSQ
jgi:ribokinase